MDSILVVGYGNELRCDDGAGVRAAEELESMRLEGVDILTRQQLVPEIAETVSRAESVIFLDAMDAGADASVEVRSIQPSSTTDVLTHSCEPQALLALTQAVFGRCPRAWSVTIPGNDFDFGRRLSARAIAGIETAVREVSRLCEKLNTA
jgi:hydrogenase maturation protease